MRNYMYLTYCAILGQVVLRWHASNLHHRHDARCLSSYLAPTLLSNIHSPVGMVLSGASNNH